MSRSQKSIRINLITPMKTITILVLVLLILPILPISTGEFSIDQKSIKQDSSEIYPVPTGFVFSTELVNRRGLSMDSNDNHIEDFIELNKQLYNADEYIEVIVSLNYPANDWIKYQFEQIGCVDVEKFTIIDALGAKVPTHMIGSVSNLPGVELIQSVHKLKPSLNNGVPLTRASQSILTSNGYGGITGKGITVAVIDTGIDSNHVTFGDRIVAFKDFWYGNDDLDPTDGMNARDYGSQGVYHGTMVTSCSSGSGTYKGAATKSYIVSVAVDNTYQMVQGIQWCVNNKNKDFNKDGEPDGPDIISMSMGVQGTLAYLDNAAGSAMDNGVVFVTSAGNDGPNDSTVTSPATSKKVIAVGATDKYNKVIASFSSRGPGPGGIIKPNVVAPGLNLVVAWPGNQWVAGGTGTSFAAPIVAGICALILEYDPELGPYEVRQILETSAEDRGAEGPDNTYGYGFVDAISALDLVLKVKSLTASSKNVIEDTVVTFTAVASGTNVNKYEWDWENDGSFDDETEDNSIQHKFTQAGSKTIVVRVTNNKGKSAESSVDIEVINRDPDATLEIDGAPEFIFEDDIIVFNASKSWDTPSDINSLEFAWSFNNGINFTNFSKWDGVISHSFNKSGEYDVYVIVRDDDLETDQEKTSLVVENLKPVADAGGDRIVFEDELVHFSGFGTYDTLSDRDSLDYTWDFGDRTEGYGMNVTHSYQIEEDNQTFNVVLTVEDDENERSDSKIKVTVRNRAPTIIVMDDISGLEDQEITFHGRGNDSITDVNDLNYKWIFDDGKETDWLINPNTTYAYTEVGTYHPKLMVRDPKEAVSSKSFNVTIRNVKPSAKFTLSKSSAEEDELVEFDASETTDSASDLADLLYIWDFDDGSVAMGQKVNHRFYKAKRYSVQLKVMDDDGATSIFEDKININNRMPSAKITPMKKEYNIDTIVRFLGYQSSDTPSDKRNLTYYWDFRDGSGFQVAGMNTTFKYSEPGEYVVRLKVEDDDFETDMRKIAITILADEEEEDILANPTFENSGMYIYAGIGIIIVFLIILILSLLMYYRSNGGIFGKLERAITDRRERSERKKNLDDERINQIGTTGLTVGQEQFYKDLYGIHPAEFQQQKNLQMPIPNANMQMPMHPMPPGPVKPKLPPRDGENNKKENEKDDLESKFLEEDDNWTEED